MLAALLDQPERLRQVSSTVERLQGVGVQLDTAVTILLPHYYSYTFQLSACLCSLFES